MCGKGGAVMEGRSILGERCCEADYHTRIASTKPRVSYDTFVLVRENPCLPLPLPYSSTFRYPLLIP